MDMLTFLSSFLLLGLGAYLANARHVNNIDPEVSMNTSQIIAYHGYPVEERTVVTSDGYMLYVQRIPGSRNEHSTVSKPVVVLWHGLLSCSACWVENLVNESLAFILADAGYDVWLANSRGNTYGLRHKTLTPDQDEFWAFSWDEMAQYDLPSTIDYILTATGQKNLSYVGHSQGTTLMFAAQSAGWVPVEKVKMFAALGPAVYMDHVKGPFELLGGLSPELIETVLGKKDFLPQTEFLTWIGKEVCSKKYPDFICENILFLIAGYDFKNLNQSRIPVYVGQHPAGTSTQNMVHYTQAHQADKFQMFDYGPEGNMKKYNSTTPPLYHVENISVPVALFGGTNDWLTDPTDVARLAKQLRSVVYNKLIPDYEHLDYIWAVNAPQACYHDVMKLLKR